MSTWELVRLTKEEAVSAATEAAFEVTEADSADFGRKLVHCFAGGFGADWDLDTVVATIKDARDVGWIDHLMGHDLAVVSNKGKVQCFNVQRPKAAQAEQSDEPLIDPDCRDGKCSSCVGGPCEHSCHQPPAAFTTALQTPSLAREEA